MFTLISLIDVHIISKVLVQHPIDLAIGLWVKCHTKKQLCSHLLEQMLLKANHKLRIFIRL